MFGCIEASVCSDVDAEVLDGYFWSTDLYMSWVDRPGVVTGSDARTERTILRARGVTSVSPSLRVLTAFLADID